MVGMKRTLPVTQKSRAAAACEPVPRPFFLFFWGHQVSLYLHEENEDCSGDEPDAAGVGQLPPRQNQVLGRHRAFEGLFWPFRAQPSFALIDPYAGAD